MDDLFEIEENDIISVLEVRMFDVAKKTSYHVGRL